MTTEPMAAARERRGWRAFWSTALPWLVLVIAIPLFFSLFAIIQSSVENVAQLRFEREANSANANIEGRLRSYSDVLYALRAQFASEEPVDRLRFHRFVESLDLKHRYPGFISLNYAAYVTARDRERFEESVRNDSSLDPRGYPRFAIKPPGKRPEHFVIVYLEPMAGYEFAFGLDLGWNPAAENPEKVAAALRLGRDSGRLTSSAQPLRVQRARATIYLAMRLAVYRKGLPVDTVEQRRRAYVGSVGAGFDVENLMKEVLSKDLLRYMRIRLYDVGPADGAPVTGPAGGKRLLFDSLQLTGRAATGPGGNASGSVFTYALPVEIAGRAWEFQYSADKDAIVSVTDRVLPPMVLAGGLLSSLLLFGVLYSLASSRSRAVEIANEITKDLRESEMELRATAEQLQAMSRRLVEAQESERRQFSRELHDRVGQNLTALSINLDILKSQLADNGNEAFRSRLNDASALLESTAGAIENVMSELRPPMLDDYGLLPALQWYANEFSRRTGIQVRVDGDEAMKRLPQASEIALFRIAQEALNNVAKHAHASNVNVSIERSVDGFTMSVWDDGVGIEAAASGARRRPGLGMVTMRERTQAVGGRFEVRSASSGGTRVAVRIPG
jgi:signal transduction histidine kinase